MIGRSKTRDLVDVAGSFGVRRSPVGRAETSGRPALGRVGDQDMGVELGVAGAGGAMDVGGGEEAVARTSSWPPRPRAAKPRLSGTGYPSPSADFTAPNSASNSASVAGSWPERSVIA